MERDKKLQLLDIIRQENLFYWEYDIQNDKIEFPFPELTPPFDDNSDFSAFHEQAAYFHRKMREGKKTAERMMLGNDGKTPYSVKYVNIFDSEGKPVRARATAHPMQEFQKLEEGFLRAAENEGFYTWRIDCPQKQFVSNHTLDQLYGPLDIQFPPEGGFSTFSFPEDIHPDDIQSEKNAMNGLRSGSDTVTYKIRKRNRKTFSWDWLHITYSIIRDENRQIIHAIGSASDISSQMEEQEKFRIFQDYRNVLKQSTLAYFKMNLTKNILLDGQTSDSVILALKDAGTIDLFFQRVYNLLPFAEDRLRYEKTFSRDLLLSFFAQGEKEVSLDYRYSNSLGVLVWRRTTVEMIENPFTRDVEAVLYSTDIDTAKKTELLLQRLIDTDYSFVCLADIRTNLLSVYGERKDNKMIFHDMETPVEYTKAIEKELSSRIDSRFAQECINTLSMHNIRTRLERRSRFICTFPEKNSDTSVERFCQFKCEYIDQSKTAVLVTCSGMTEAFYAERRQKRLLQDALEQTKRANNSKTVFLSRMSHEIRNPLSGIMGMIALAEDELKRKHNAEEAEKCLEKINGSTRYLRDLINEILDMSRIESGKVFIKHDTIRLSQFVSSINTICHPQAENKGLDYISIVNDSIDAQFVGDSMKLQQVLINLIGNAVKFTEPGGAIRFMAESKENGKDKVRLVFTVEDTGIGISPKFLPNIFKPFEQEHTNRTARYEGTGLGLAISHSLIELMGGTITVESAEGSGSTFTVSVTLPSCPDSSDRNDKSSGGTYSLPRKTVVSDMPYDFSAIRILLCEDHPLNIEVAKRLLQLKKASVEIAENGKIAVDKVLSGGENYFDLILMDIRMPEMDGLEATEKIRSLPLEYTKKVPVVAMSANAFDIDIEESRSKGMNGHLAKPFEPEILFKTIADFCRK
ncbi:MAG: ATP-binding protein [Treponemataceae bacterium]|nr:ATP-binding protein [Treponemataceae bacterium]